MGRRIVLQRCTFGDDGIDAGHEHGVGVVARRRASRRPIDWAGEVTFVGVVAVTVGAVVVATGRCEARVEVRAGVVPRELEAGVRVGGRGG